MNITEPKLEKLRLAISKRLSKKRYIHTLGVEKAATFLSDYCLPEKRNDLKAAALLHDIAKEFSEAELISFIRHDGECQKEAELKATAVLHSFAAPYVIKRDFGDFASSEILSACRNHTVGSPDMNVFDEIIFISDYIEEGRTYENCKKLRESLYSSLIPGSFEHNLKMLHKAVVASIDYTVSSLKTKNAYINPNILLTRNALLSKI